MYISFTITTIWIIKRVIYSQITQTDGRWAKNWKIERLGPIVDRHRHRYLQNFWSADDFIVEARKLKVSLTDPPILRSFVIGEASGDGRPMIDRLFEEIYIMKSADGRPIIWCQSAIDRPTVGWWHFIEEPSADRRRISAVIRPMIAWLSGDHKH